METQIQKEMTRREVISKAFFGMAGALLASVIPRRTKDARREDIEKNISDYDASYYKRLLG